MSWIDVYVTDAVPEERILLAHWESLGGWVRSLPHQVKVPALVGLLGGPLPVELTAAQVRRLESELTLLGSIRWRVGRWAGGRPKAEARLWCSTPSCHDRTSPFSHSWSGQPSRVG